MKKFLIFLVAVVTVVCLSMTFYQFAKNDEVIKVNTADTIYINAGETLSLDDIGFSRSEARKDTKINFNAGGDEVTSIIKYDEVNKCYIPTNKGGSTTIKITTNNKKYKTFTIDVVVGIGSEECPYYISNEDQLFSIGSKYSLNSHFQMVNDIDVASSHLPIGLIDGSYSEFEGSFNGNYHTINNLKIDTCDFGGLFAIIGANATVYNLNVENAVLEGKFNHVGTIAGINYGTINKIMVINSTINNSHASGNTGAVVGLLSSDKTSFGSTASMMRVGAYTDAGKTISSNGTLGGLAGTADNAYIHACYTSLLLENTSNNVTGGLVGQFIIDRDSYIRECYSVSNITAKSGVTGNIVGSIIYGKNVKSTDINKNMVFLGVYFNNELNSYKGVGVDNTSISNSTSFAINGKNTSTLKLKGTYVYYITSSNNIKYWDSVWYLVDGQYPILTYTNRFSDVELNDSENPIDKPENPDITNPNTPSTNSVIISNKNDLINNFQNKNVVYGTYILNSDIDLDGMVWKPVKFQGTFKSNDGEQYTISNFSIDATGSHVGFFSILGTSKISNVKFDNVTIESSVKNETVGTLVGYISGNTDINSVSISNAKIDTNATYVGGIVGYTNNSIVTITDCDAKKLVIGGQSNNVGGFAGYLSANTSFRKIKISTSIDGIKAIKRVGGLVATNYGYAFNNEFNGNISSVNQTENSAYFGGLAGVNYGEMIASISTANIFVNNATADCQYFVGGVCGYNLGSLKVCHAWGKANTFDCTNGTNKTYFGGLAAYNKGSVEDCKNIISKIGNLFANTETAGLACYNYGGKIVGCESTADLLGNSVAGLVLYNGNGGIVDSCFAGASYNDRATYSGKYVASFTIQITSGEIVDCLVNANLTSNNQSGWVAGFAGFMPYSSDMFGKITTCVANVSLGGVGSKYLDCKQEGLLKASQTTGTIKNCIISKDADVKGVIVATYSKSKLFGLITIKTYSAGSGSCYNVVATSDIQAFATYTNCNFDISNLNSSNSKWHYFNNTCLPLPRQIAIKVYAAG